MLYSQWKMAVKRSLEWESLEELNGMSNIIRLPVENKYTMFRCLFNVTLF